MFQATNGIKGEHKICVSFTSSYSLTRRAQSRLCTATPPTHLALGRRLADVDVAHADLQQYESTSRTTKKRLVSQVRYELLTYINVIILTTPTQYINQFILQIIPMSAEHLYRQLCYLRAVNIVAGASRKVFHRLEKRATVAPSITRWSADQLTSMMCVGATSPVSVYRGSFCMQGNGRGRRGGESGRERERGGWHLQN